MPSKNSNVDEINNGINPSNDSENSQWIGINSQLQRLNPPINTTSRGILGEARNILCTTFLSSVVGYSLGSLIRFSVDLANEGFDKIQEKSENEIKERYFNSNFYSFTGLSIGMFAGLVAYIVVSELFKQRQERDFELQTISMQSLGQDQAALFDQALRDRMSIGVNQAPQAMIDSVGSRQANPDPLPHQPINGSQTATADLVFIRYP